MNKQTNARGRAFKHMSDDECCGEMRAVRASVCCVLAARWRVRSVYMGGGVVGACGGGGAAAGGGGGGGGGGVWWRAELHFESIGSRRAL
jgi:hypothetical protein